VYSNGSTIDVHLIGEGYPGVGIIGGGALECHTDDPTCCRGIDSNGTGRGEWYYPNGSLVPRIGESNSAVYYRTRSHMVVRLNVIHYSLLFYVTGVFKCILPSADGTNITRFIKVVHTGTCMYINIIIFLNVYIYIFKLQHGLNCALWFTMIRQF